MVPTITPIYLSLLGKCKQILSIYICLVNIDHEHEHGVLAEILWCIIFTWYKEVM